MKPMWDKLEKTTKCKKHISKTGKYHVWDNETKATCLKEAFDTLSLNCERMLNFHAAFD